MRVLLWLVFLCFPSVITAQSSADSVRFLELGRTYTRWAYWGMADSLHPHLSKDLAAAVSRGKFETFLATLVDRAGNEVEVVSERLEFAGDQVTYTRDARYEDKPGVRAFVWTLDRDGVIQRFTLNPSRP